MVTLGWLLRQNRMKEIDTMAIPIKSSASNRFVLKSSDGTYLTVKTDYSPYGYGGRTRIFIWDSNIECADVFHEGCYEVVLNQFPRGSVSVIKILRQETYE